MPTYDYECAHCGYKFEVFQRITESHLSKCPKCNNKLKRLIGSGSGVIFKGKGFYATDYRKNSSHKSDSKQGAACPKNKDGCQSCQSE